MEFRVLGFVQVGGVCYRSLLTCIEVSFDMYMGPQHTLFGSGLCWWVLLRVDRT